MKVIAVYGSGRKKGFSAKMVDKALETFKDKNPEIKKYYLTNMNIKPCIGCFTCRRKEGCVRKDDMTQLFEDIIESDFVIFSSPVYCFDVSSSFKMMFERLYPMLEGGMALGEGLKKYNYRYPKKKCMMLLAQGAPGFMCRNVKKRVNSNLKMNGFDNIGTVVCNSTYFKKSVDLDKHVTKKITKICNKAMK